MRLSSILYALTYYLVSFILLPYIFITLNLFFHFPIFRNSILQLIGIIFIATGIGYSFYSYRLFFIKGKGTPVPIQPTKKLMTEGIYKYTRNPIYLAHFLLAFGIFLLQGYSLLILCFILFVFSIHLYTVFIEEKGLKKRFGNEYIAYTKSTPRYFPKLLK